MKRPPLGETLATLGVLFGIVLGTTVKGALAREPVPTSPPVTTVERQPAPPACPPPSTTERQPAPPASPPPSTTERQPAPPAIPVMPTPQAEVSTHMTAHMTVTDWIPGIPHSDDIQKAAESMEAASYDVEFKATITVWRGADTQVVTAAIRQVIDRRAVTILHSLIEPQVRHVERIAFDKALAIVRGKGGFGLYPEWHWRIWKFQ